MLGEEHRAVYKKKRQRFIMIMALMVIMPVMIVIGLTVLKLPEKVIEGPALVLLIGGVIWLFFDWRCPRCNRSFVRKSNPKFCSECGLQLRG